ncbi:MAG: serine--tRNA ligase [Thermoanaerobaculales bacterium]|jgi:seryl-tRNA synthetase|nr:serine--tRNA ligase [Thermoanaerobaculales bacterium]
MLSRELYRNDPDRVRRMLELRRTDAPIDRLLGVDAEWRSLLVKLEELKAARNAGSKEIGALYRDGKRQEAEAKKTAMASIGDEISSIEEQTRILESELQNLELRFPNLPAETVPEGRDESDNVEKSRSGTPPDFDFEAQAHWDLGPALGIIDFERAVTLAGARFAVLRGVGAAMERALVSYMLDLHTTVHGYTEIMPPVLVNSASLEGTGQLPKFAEDLFAIANSDLYLSPTAEVQLTNLHRNEVLPEDQLPIKYCAFTPCFRAEAGSYGKDVRGLIRLHQFNKVELVQLTRPEDSEAAFGELTGHAEAVLRGLRLPYRAVSLCTGDLGFSAAETTDLEVWLPGQNAYREISSCSSFTDFQARRARLRYKPSDGGRARLVHTLNGSGLAVGRTMVAVLENYQRADGSVVIPEVLRPYMGGLEVIEPTA